MDDFYPAGPKEIPTGFTRPSRRYKRHVWLALLALVAFVALYLTLTGWFVWTTYRLLAGATDGGKNSAFGFFAAVPMAFLSLFLLKALFFWKKSDHKRDYEIRAADEPVLFAFLHRIADEAGAPRPYRVFLSPQVNAAVFYDLSVLNLILPSRKNLDIGLGLVNSLTLSELKAVLAHEFGHFGQRSMAVGRWVYVAQRIAAHIVAKRDALDRFLRVISGIDLRIAWIGWLLRIVVWSLRAVLETAFSLVVLAERALSREMEMQADLVAVSLTGSDALVHALHKAGAADAAFDQAVGIAAGQYEKGKTVPDLFLLQSRVMERVRHVLADAGHGVAPPLPEEDRAAHRVFEQRSAHPPRMWASHPPNREREENAKRVYVDCNLDERSAWSLFADPDKTRAEVTELVLGFFEKPATGVEKLTPDAALEAVDDTFDIIYLDPRYRGAYLGRSVVRNAKKADELYLALDGGTAPDELYPESLRRALEQWKTLESERAMLEGLERGLLEAGGSGSVRFRGEVLQRKQLPVVLEQVKTECRAAHLRLDEFDRNHRSHHLVLAEKLGQGWPEYLRSLIALLHYADHTEANIRDARGHLANVFSVVTADGRVTAAEAQRLVVSGSDVHFAMQQAFDQRKHVRLPVEVAKALGVESWKAALPDGFGLEIPEANNIGEWLQVIDGWLDGFIVPFDALERRSLEALLRSEAKVSAFASDASALEPAPEPAKIPKDYPTLVPGAERERQWRLDWWDRFQVAEGFGPAAARFCVAGGVIGATIFAASSVGSPSLVIYNGLGRTVSVHVGSEERKIGPYRHATIDDPGGPKLLVRTETLGGQEIEHFEAELTKRTAQYVYNVAGASPLVRWTAVYGSERERPPEPLGTVRWSTTDATELFVDPPKTVQTKGGGATRAVLSGVAEEGPALALSVIDDTKVRDELVRLHARWDDGTERYTADWMARAGALPDLKAILGERLTRDPHDVVTLRMEQDVGSPAEQKATCARHQELGKANPNEPNLLYVAMRCRPLVDRDPIALETWERFRENPWLALLAGYAFARQSAWTKALDAWEVARRHPPLIDHVSLDRARIFRFLGGDQNARVVEIAKQSPVVQRMLDLESGNDLPEGPIQAYPRLAIGNLSGAIGAVTKDDALRPRILRLVAGSKGAEAYHAGAVFELGEDSGIDSDTIWAAIGLAVREKKATAALEKQLEKLVDTDELEAAKAFMDPQALLTDPDAKERALTKLGPEARGHAFAMACIILGDEAPEEWLRAAQTLLFASERPYL